MSHKNGNRSRFDKQRKSKMHNRTRIRNLRAELTAKSATTPPKTEATAV